ncbi:hypothetical protein KYK30_11200 [Shinella yambaruensis]|uniref:Uncharacterized protein n=1 Tax=Shinella yambaruensis TaxID=415996 RepID=A0ABQ5ZBV5_9HYPH|nr:hypothetical protein [Shinella yambaruensis]MCJ8028254.1 hypothetical protein [Shinella yambaruensis]MCU7980264.1 hypothetical protein [Shinella yambaruensis]GLR49219.1 hypothetical protein GCM10007923_04240 [Shinella yambaruensis]
MQRNLIWILDIDGTPLDFGPPYAPHAAGDDNTSDEQEPTGPTADAGNTTATPTTP